MRKWETETKKWDEIECGKPVQKTTSVSWEIMVLIHTDFTASTNSELFDKFESDSDSESEAV